MELDLEVRLMGETLVINRSLDPLNGDYIELNDLNEPFELRRTQGDDFMPTIEEGEDIVKEISTNIGEEFTNLEILKCWSLETSRRLFNTQSCSINLHGESTEQISGEFLILILFNSRI
ncbi:hypothetical protein Tco_0635214 [Tanacetum coccineum]